MRLFCYDRSKMSLVENNNYLNFLLTFKGFMDSIVVSRKDVDSIRRELNAMLETLTEREERILRLRYGLSEENDGRRMLLEQVARVCDISEERARQIEAKALRKLKHPSRSRFLTKLLKEPYSEYKNQGDYLSEYLNSEQQSFNEALQQKLKKEVYSAVIDNDFSGCFVSAIMKRKNMLIVSMFDEQQLSLPLEDLNLSVRSYNCLMRAGITTARELFNLSEKDLSRIRNLGSIQMQEINQKFKELVVSEQDNPDKFKNVILKIGDDKVIYKSESLEGIADSIYKVYFMSNKKSKVIFEESISNTLKYYLLMNGFLFTEDVRYEITTSQGLLSGFEKIGLGKYASELQSYFGDTYLLFAVSDELFDAIDSVDDFTLENLVALKDQQVEGSKLEIELFNLIRDIEQFQVG